MDTDLEDFQISNNNKECINKIKPLWPISSPSKTSSSPKSRKSSTPKKCKPLIANQSTLDRFLSPIKKDKSFTEEVLTDKSTIEANMDHDNTNSENHNPSENQENDTNFGDTLLYKDSANSIIKTMISGEQWQILFDFLMGITNFLPSEEVLQEIISCILWGQKNKWSKKAYVYLTVLKESFPPSLEHQDFYYNILFSRCYGQKPFDIIENLLSCCLKKRCHVYSTQSECSKNCLLFFKYIINILEKNHELVLETANTGTKTLISKVFWPLGNPESVGENTRCLIKWINSYYECYHEIETVEILDILHKFLSMVAETSLYHSELNDLLVVSCSFYHVTVMEGIKNEIFSTCLGIKENPEVFEKFLRSLRPLWLNIIVCEKFLNYIDKKESRYKEERLSLRTIVFKYMIKKMDHQIKHDQKNLYKRNISSFTNKKSSLDLKRFPLHHACFNKKVGDLDDLLDDVRSDIELKDKWGRTPLHYACAVESYECVDVFLDRMHQILKTEPEKFQSIFDGDKDGITPLHISICQNHTSAVELMLPYSGIDSLNYFDNSGITPLMLTPDKAMTSILQNFMRQEENEQLMLNFTSCNIILCETSEDSYIHFLCLYLLLSNYIKVFGLHKLDYNSEDLQTVIKDHLYNKKDSKLIEHLHDDIGILKYLKQFISKFCKLTISMPKLDNCEEVLDCLQFLECTL